MDFDIDPNMHNLSWIRFLLMVFTEKGRKKLRHYFFFRDDFYKKKFVNLEKLFKWKYPNADKKKCELFKKFYKKVKEVEGLKVRGIKKDESYDNEFIKFKKELNFNEQYKNIYNDRKVFSELADIEEKEICTKDGIKIQSMCFMPKKPHNDSSKKIALVVSPPRFYIHYNFSILGHEKLYNRFAIKFRGCGENESNRGIPNKEAIRIDYEAAYEYLVKEKKYDPKDIVIVGYCAGCDTAYYLAKKYKASSLILVSPPKNLIDRKLTYFLPKMSLWLLDSSYDFGVGDLYNVKCPVHIICGTNDRITPLKDNAQKIYEATKNDDRYIILHKFKPLGHYLWKTGEERHEKVRDLIADIFCEEIKYKESRKVVEHDTSI